MSDRRRTFGPVVGAGLAAGALAAVAASRAWVGVDSTGTGAPFPDDVEQAAQLPLASALSLVVLACWGVVLVTRGRTRRAVAGVGLLGSTGLAASVVVGLLTLPDRVADTVLEVAPDSDPVTGLTGWFWASAASAVVLVATTALATAWCPAWPEMGSRYDAPGGAAEPDRTTGERSNLDLWKSLDEGRDPTA